MVVDLMPVVDSWSMENKESKATNMVNSSNNNSTSITNMTPPSPTSNFTMSAHMASSTSLRNLRLMDEAAKAAIVSFARQQAPLLADMVAQRLSHVAVQTGVDIDTLHGHFIAEFLPVFLESLHSDMAAATGAQTGEQCATCFDVSQRISVPVVGSCPAPADVPFQKRSNSVSFTRAGKASPPPSLADNSPGNHSLLSSMNTASVYSLNKCQAQASHPVGKLRSFLGNFHFRKRTTSTPRETSTSPSDTAGLSSPSFSLSVDVVIEGLLEVHTKAPESTRINFPASRSGLSNNKDLHTVHNENEKDDEDDFADSGDAISKSNEHLVDSPWLPCHVRLLRSPAGPLLVLSYPTDVGLPPCGISLSTVSEVRAATIGDAITSDNHTFILISTSLSRRLLLKASSRADMNRWLDALRPCAGYRPSAMVPLFPVNKFGMALPSTPTGTSSNGLHKFGFSPGYHTEASASRSTVNQNLSRSVSFMGRRRIMTSPAVDLQHLMRQSKGQKGQHAHSASTAGDVTANSDSGCSQTNSIDILPINTPPRSSSPVASQSGHHTPSLLQKQRPLQTYPWYWGTVSRNEAADAVCMSGPNGSGCFLIRQSESQQGDCVVTFNCGGEAKHLRIKVYTDGHCQIQQYAQYSFPSVQALVDHFRTNALPLDLGGYDITLCPSLANGVMLTNYVSRRPKTPLSVKS